MFAVNIRADLKPLHRAFVDLKAKQAPFATALALTTLAKGVQAAEDAEIAKTFSKSTPFTRNAIAIVPATKSKPVAIVFPKDVQAAYLAPYVVGGNRSLGSKQGMLVPIGAATNQYGNLTKGQLARLKGKPNVFVGSVTFRKNGKTVNGVWQRSAVPRGKRRDGERGTRGDSQGKIYGVRTTLKLLIEFSDTTQVKKHLDFYGRANAYLKANAAREFGAAMQRALATSR
ncbi:hypothetical protein [Sphingomonas sp. CARO-RG-8B-R24-01]|uniref:hypothetical protein n=1 Tax=Sphingomonas sp. CARO-RG-8B-R24-01 TaxID=2914831 RepID=UPI001F5729DF|nr:hypothetical protein [Sphingomonas sp. CARO-RG-8B-R24-01]